MQNTLPSASDYSSLGAPAFKYARVWSATDMYFFYPNALWDEPGSKIVFTQKNHNLTTSDTVNLVPGNATLSPGWNQSGLTATVIDADTFTVPMLFDPGPVPNGLTSLPGPQALVNNGLMVTCMKYSKLMFTPTIIQGDVLPNDGTQIIIEGKVHPSALWVSLHAAYAFADGNWGLTISPVYNFVRGRLSAGAGQPVVYCQF